MRTGGVPSRAGQLARTSSWLAPSPPAVTTTAWARSSKVPAATREVGAPRAAPSAARTVPATPSIVPPVPVRASARWRNRSSTRPRSAAARTRRSNGSTTPGPVPQVMWKRGTELPGPVAVPPPRSAQPTTGNSRWPIARSQARFSPAAKST